MPDDSRAEVEAAVAAIRSGPQGPDIAAIFDFGGTVVERFALSRRVRRRGRAQEALSNGLRPGMDGDEYRRFLDRLAPALAGTSEQDATAVGEQLFERAVYGRLYPEAWQLIRAHEAAGHTVVLVSSLTRFQVAPAARELGITHVLCTRMATEGDTLTGKVDGNALRGADKAEAVRRFAADHGVDLSRTFCYADSESDLPLLSLVGHPAVVNADRPLASTAAERDWPALTFVARRDSRPIDYVRTVASLLGMLVGVFFGLAIKAPTRNRQRMADALMAHGASSALRIAGVRVRVTGAENARTPRPAVFLFNHQSQLDIVVMPKVVPGPLAPIAKKELTKNPVFGPILRFIGATFIDRADSAQAKAALAPVVETLRSGLSIAVAPEGTRSYTPGVGSFKKGAFHIAIQAGVPVIPVVIRNAGECCWRNAVVVRKGTVDVAVLPPIDVGDWDPNHMDDKVDAVRRQFTDTLLDWPSLAAR